MEPYVTPETISASTHRWLEHISPFNTHTMQLNREKSALLVVDMQQFFLDPASPTFTCGGLASLLNLSFGFAWITTVEEVLAQTCE